MSTPVISILPDRRIPPEPVLRRIDGPGPRYTSYPTADRFADGFAPERLGVLLDEHRHACDRGEHAPLSIYVHIPFCESLCYYCACNKIITKHHDRAGPYLDALEREIGLVVTRLGAGRAISQLHFGGGSPTFLSDHELARLMATLRRVLDITPDAEISIEVDPRTVTADRKSVV